MDGRMEGGRERERGGGEGRDRWNVADERTTDVSYLHYMLTCYQSELGRHDSKALLAAAINPICEPTVNTKKIIKMNEVCKISHTTGESSPIPFGNSIGWVLLRPLRFNDHWDGWRRQGQRVRRIKVAAQWSDHLSWDKGCFPMPTFSEISVEK